MPINYIRPSETGTFIIAPINSFPMDAPLRHVTFLAYGLIGQRFWFAWKAFYCIANWEWL